MALVLSVSAFGLTAELMAVFLSQQHNITILPVNLQQGFHPDKTFSVPVFALLGARYRYGNCISIVFAQPWHGRAGDHIRHYLDFVWARAVAKGHEVAWRWYEAV